MCLIVSNFDCLPLNACCYLLYANLGAKNVCVVAIWRCPTKKGLPTRTPSYAKVAARSIHCCINEFHITYRYIWCRVEIRKHS